MREMKMRAWLIKDKLLVDVLQWIDNGRIGVCIQDSGPFIKRPEEFVLEHFIGQRDRNGVPIFEGDKVKKPAKKTVLEDMVSVETTIEGIVEYNSEECCFEIKQTREGVKVFYDRPTAEYPKGYASTHENCFYDEMGSWFSWKELEVIGNIHA